MRRDEVSIADIARVAGVSHTTVSRALRESPLISIDTRAYIQRLAREMGYTPNAIARSLQQQQTSTLGLVISSIADPFLADVVKGVEEVARVAKFSILLGTSHNDPEQEMAVIETFHQRRVDGILIESSRITPSYNDRLAALRIPTVLINSQADVPSDIVHWVSVDDYRGAQLAVEHVLQLGHRCIGYLGVSNRPRSNRHRLRGYQDALTAAGVSLRDEWVIVAPGTETLHEEDVTVGQTWLFDLLNTGITAVFCYNDMVAISLLMACHTHGIAVPQQLSIVGFDDIALASCVAPTLTTVQQPKVQLGHIATQMMLDLLRMEPVENHILSPTLIVRASIAPLVV